MPISVVPERCPDCEEPFHLEYSALRGARMRWRAKAVFLAGIILTVVLLPTFLFVVEELVSQWTGLNTRFTWQVRLLIVLYLVTIPIALLPSWIAGRYAFSRPRQAAVRCPRCRWSGSVLVMVKNPAIQAAQNVKLVEQVEVEGIGYISDPLDARRARQQRRLDREQRRAREIDHESPPNPDFDFGER